MDAPFVGISSAGANRFNLTFPGISGEYPLITERTEYGVKVKEMLGTAGWDGILNDKLSDIDEHACRHVCDHGEGKRVPEERVERKPVCHEVGVLGFCRFVYGAFFT